VKAVDFDGTLILKEDDLREDLLLKPGARTTRRAGTDIPPSEGNTSTRAIAVGIADSVRIDDHKVDIPLLHQPARAAARGQYLHRRKRSGADRYQSEITVKPGEVCRTTRCWRPSAISSKPAVLGGRRGAEHVDTDNVVDIRIRVRERRESWVEAGFGVGNVLGGRVCRMGTQPRGHRPYPPCGHLRLRSLQGRRDQPPTSSK
jgi:hypothetical protein